MSKLLQRLSDASRSGVYRAAIANDIVDAARGSNLRVTSIELHGVTGKDALLNRISSALQFPDWFGRNWDALKDCLGDLSWLESHGHVLVFDDAECLPAEERDMLIEILESVAPQWASEGKPFFAILIGGKKALPALYREKN